MNIIKSGKTVEKLTVSYTQKGYSRKDENSFYAKLCIDEVSYSKFIELIESGHSFKQIPNIAALKNNVRTITENGNNPIVNAKNIKDGIITMNILQRRVAMQYCQFQTVFFDIDNCSIDYKELVSNLSLKPNLIYETFSHTEDKHRYRLVYVLDCLIDTGFYRAVYLAFKEQIKDVVEDDKCAENPTQTIYGTCNNVYRIYDYYYSIDTSNLDFIFYGDFVLRSYTKSIVERNFYNYCTTHNIEDILKEYSIYNDNSEYKCIDMENETPNNITEKFVVNKKGLLALPHYKGNRQKLIINDGRKRYTDMIAHLLLLMNKDLVIEDLIYNVLKWTDMHLSHNKKINEHVLNNKIIIEICINCFCNFKENKNEKYKGYLNRIKTEFVSTLKKAINPYYYALHYQDNTFFYWCNSKLIDSTFKSKPDISLSDLKKELSAIKVERNKAVKCRSDKGKKRNIYTNSKRGKVIEMLHDGLSNKKITEQLQVSSQYISKIKSELKKSIENSII